MEVKIVPVKIGDKEILRKMIKVYEKEMLGENVGEYKYFDCYWENKNRWPFFIVNNKENIGFVLVNQHCLTEKEAKNLGEFYIIKKLRRQKFGLNAANKIFNMFKGKWEIREISENPKARLFWIKTIKEYTNDNFKEIEMNNENWNGWIQTFDNNTL